jgi:hypothetical protein
MDRASGLRSVADAEKWTSSTHFKTGSWVTRQQVYRPTQPGWSDGGAKVTIHLRTVFAPWSGEISQTLPDAALVDEELRHLIEALASP